MPPALVMRGVAKAFGAVRALDGVDLEVARGEVHALVGENGAGKSTLMKVLSGAVQPDAGTLLLDGAPYCPDGPSAARRAGVAMIYQELTLAPHLSVEDNVMLGVERRRLGWALRAEARPQVREALEFLGLGALSPRRRVGDLGPGERQLVEIARALVGEMRVLVLDEPTSSLSREDAERLFSVVRRLRDKGVAVVYISHFLEEVKALCDRFTVLRDGRTEGSGPIATTPVEALVTRMVGRDLDELFPHVPHVAGAPVLRAQGLRDAGGSGSSFGVRDASFTLRRGEILGVAGLVGAGRTELLRTLFGLRSVDGGRVERLDSRGEAEPLGPGPAGRLAQGLGLLSEDRKVEGLALGLSIGVNTTLSRLGPYRRGPFLSLARRDAAARHWMQRLGVKAPGPATRVGALSGGNQQKVALARLLHHDVEVLLLDEPTRGVDVGAKAEIYRLLAELAAAGKALLVVSSYNPELLGLCDRIAVVHRGVLGPARPVEEWDEERLLLAATRGTEPSRAPGPVPSTSPA